MGLDIFGMILFKRNHGQLFWTLFMLGTLAVVLVLHIEANQINDV